MSGIYALQSPTAWAEPPQEWSHSSIEAVSECPRRWQLLRSRWGDHAAFPVRPHPAAVEGQIIHDALDRLVRACGERGWPAFGSAPFQEALAEADFFGGFATDLEDWERRHREHPRPGPPFRLRATPQELANRAVRLFRAWYPLGLAPAAAVPTASRSAGARSAPMDLDRLLRVRGALSEVKLRHPTLPFVGVLDRVQVAQDGVEIIDFKSGGPQPGHRKQLLRYALLWFRATGAAPVRISVQHLDHRESWDLQPADLLSEEGLIGAGIRGLHDVLLELPAAARPGPHCQACPVRVRCDVGWEAAVAAPSSPGRTDLELLALEAPGPLSFLGRTRGGEVVVVVYERRVASKIPAFSPGQRLRILGGQLRDAGFEMRPWTEVFLCGPMA